MAAEADEEAQFGPYLVYERLGVGGMATVHRALERGIEGFERIVALKRLLPHLAEDASFIKAFVREAKLASALNHVNIVQIFELGRVGTEYFISMEYIDGRDIRRILRHARKVTGPPPINVTVGLLLQLCDALDYAHNKVDERGSPMLLVHRDVSPSNVLVTSAGHVKVIDFGIAKAQSSQLRTQTGRVKGKLAYMAPEAIAGGKELDARSDLFAVGVIAHELLTARPLFASKNEYQTLLKVQRGDIMPPSTFNQSCHPELDAIVLRALARDPDQRYAGAAELREDLFALRKRYNLATSMRDIATWLDWAFSLEIPTGGFAGNTGDQPSVSLDPRTPGRGRNTPARGRLSSDVDDAVEIAWGGEQESADVGPIVLDDVPDVSGKHLAPPVPARPSGNRLDAQRLFDDEEVDDDIPTPAPSHGRAPSRPTPRPSSPPARPSSPPLRPSSPPARDSTQIETPRGRRSTAPGHTPAPGPRSGRYETQTTDPDGSSLVDALHAANNAAATMREMPAADTQPSLPAMSNSMPVIRFKDPSTPPPNAPAPSVLPVGVPVKPVRTKPGVPPVRAVTAARPIDDDDAPTLAPDSAAPIPLTSKKVKAASSGPTIGQAMIHRQKAGPRRSWVILAGIVAAGAIATAVTLYLTRDEEVKPVTEQVQPRVAPRTVGTVKFNLEPADAEIVIGGKLAHAGSPFQVELEAGVHQIQINRTGYKAWLTALELSATETQTLRVVLEPLGTAVAVAEPEGTLILSSTPSGLEAVLDGKVLPMKTPIKMPIKVGPHTIALRQNGEEVWRQDLVAIANAEHEFSPSMDATKQRERAERKAAPAPSATADDEALPSVTEAATAPTPPPPTHTPSTVAAPTTPAPSPTAPSATASTTPTPTSPPKAPAVTTAPSTAPSTTTTAPSTSAPTTTSPSLAKPAPSTTTPPTAPAIAKIAPTQPPAPPRIAGPVTIPPTKVTKLSGSVPELSQTRRAEVPPSVAAKLCIDHTGAVTSAELITKLEARAALEMVQTLKGWRYTPYKPTGSPTASAACFAVSFRVK